MRGRWSLGCRAAGLALLLMVTACTADPPPAVDRSQQVVTTTAVAATTNSVVIAVDDLGTGFNPHLLADQSPVGTAVANLVLPSVFRPVTDSSGWSLDTSLAVSAQVTGTAPFTVTYVLRSEAQWSDGAPVAAEDFRYLWQQMNSQPGVVGPAGYGLIDDVSSSGGGKTVTVTFRDAYPAWRQLFTGLLPSHLLKDSPGGFTDALDNNITFSASRFSVASVDRNRGEVQLQRNDRFWDAPAALDEIRLRRGGTAGQLGESLRTNDAQLAMVRADAGTRTQVRAIPGLRTSEVPQPAVMQVTVDTADPRFTDASVRRGLLGLLDPTALTTIGTGLDATSDPGASRARAQILAPSEPGYAATAPPRLTVTQARGLLTDGGYAFSGGRYRRAGQDLAVVVGADVADPVATAVAQATADQLTVAGVDATTSLLPSTQLYGTALTTGAVDLVVGRVAAGGDLATTLASRFGCPGGAAGRPTGPTGATATTTPTTAPAQTGARAAVRTGNVSGLCDPGIDAAVAAALTGARDAREVVDQLEPTLWAMGAVLPLYQDSVLLAVRPNVTGVSPPGPLLAGPVAGAATWKRTGG